LTPITESCRLLPAINDPCGLGKRDDSDCKSGRGQEMNEEVDRGRKIVLAIIVAAIAFSAFSIITFITTVGPQRLLFQIVRFVLTILLGVFLYRGTKWVYWVSVILFGFAGVIGLMGAFLLGDTLMVLGSVAMGVVYVLSAWVLVYSNNVRLFLEQQRRR
jgi:peptidoglycan/LPS O-acetylase OafA/YrhL